jgi:putative FmdB family regulatory protein
MPLYEYKCIKCGNKYEKLQSINSEPDKVCPNCNAKVEKTLFPSALQFKGSGWYVNDYAVNSK